jgi:hypothetical protein
LSALNDKDAAVRNSDHTGMECTVTSKRNSNFFSVIVNKRGVTKSIKNFSSSRQMRDGLSLAKSTVIKI